MKKERVKWLDVAKGIGIILIMYSHAPGWWVTRNPLFAWHVPLFFFLSGYTFYLIMDHYPTFGRFFSSAWRHLIWPYLIFASLNALFWTTIFNGWAHKHFNLPKMLGAIVPTILTGERWSWPMDLIGPLYFLLALFFAQIIFYWLARWVKRRDFMIGILIIISILAFRYIHGLHSTLWCLDLVPLALVFYGLGYLTRIEWWGSVKLSIPTKTIGTLILLTIFWQLQRENVLVSYFTQSYGRYDLFYGAALLGIGLTILLARQLQNNRFLGYVGRHSLLYLGLHYSILYPMYNYVVFHRAFYSPWDVPASGWLGVLYVILTIVIVWPIGRYLDDTR